MGDKDARFPFVVVDEAGQQTQNSTLLALQRGCLRCVLLGDHKQLPPTIMCRAAADEGYATSLFELLIERHKDWGTLLETQRRMHASIADFPSTRFYAGLLKTADECSRPPVQGIKWPGGEGAERLLFVNVNTEEEKAGTSFRNSAEAGVVQHLVELAVAGGTDLDEIGVATPYKQQKYLLQETLTGPTQVAHCDTVDGFQGSERRLMIISLVRANPHGTLGFCRDVRRMNVAMTRARDGLIVVGNEQTLMNCWQYDAPHEDSWVWREWVTQVRSKGAAIDWATQGPKKAKIVTPAQGEAAD